MADRNSLTEHLVDAAAEAVFNEPTHYDEVGQQYRYDAAAAVAAVLREMTKRGWHLASDDGNSALHPEGMAKDIEQRR